ncbi:MAG: GNAT family N-acetyltransferase, partial [Gammaproteobacteria bacterium]|nr:GNAT family N-acetyltransferase [Gammaproteobacteria bacterium]
SIKEKEFVIICIMGEARVQELRNILRENGLSVFDTPADAVDVFAGLAAYRRQRELVKDLPLAYSIDLIPRIPDARQTINLWVEKQQWIPLRSEVTRLLDQLDLPLPAYLEAGSLKQALSHAESTGFPLRVKPQAPISIRRSEGTWASDMKSLRYLYLSLIAEQQRQKLWSRGVGVLMQQTDTSKERLLSLRLKIDDHPVWKRRLTIKSRAGHSVCELFPLSELLNQAMLHRGQLPYIPALSEILLKVSALASEFPQISSMELDINLYDDDSARVEDAYLELRDDYPQGRYQHLLLHPYPPDLEYQELLDDGKTFFVRPLIPRDADEADQFLKHVSRGSLYQRFLHSVPEMTDNMVRQLTLLDFHNELALIAGLDPEHEPVGIARFARIGDNCDFSILIRDDMHGKGLGKRLMKRLILGARLYGFRSIQGDVLPDNTAMLALAHSLGFSSELDVENGLIHINLPLEDSGTEAA